MRPILLRVVTYIGQPIDLYWSQHRPIFPHSIPPYTEALRPRYILRLRAVDMWRGRRLYRGSLYPKGVGLHQRRDGSCQTEDNTGSVSDHDRPVSLRLLEQAVEDPEGTVDRCDERLDPVPLLTIEVALDRADIRDIHKDSSHRSDGAQDGEELTLCHILLRINEYNLIGCEGIKTIQTRPPPALLSRFSSKITDYDRAQKSRGYARTACAVGIAPEGYARTRGGYRLVTYFFARSYWAASSPSGSCLVVWSSSVILPSPTL